MVKTPALAAFRASRHGEWVQSGLASTLLSLVMIAAFLLAGGGLWLILKRRDRKKGLLMLAAALVFIGNVLIWTV
jgi:hypothetical protein